MNAIDCNTNAGWQAIFRHRKHTLHSLLTTLGLTPSDVQVSEQAAAQFPIQAPPLYLAQIRPGDPHDPLLRQILPLAAELATPSQPAWRDPVGDQPASPMPGLIQKYEHRVLIMASPTCAIHCRYCFRRHFPYAPLTPDQRHRILDHIRHHPAIQEVIFSGGDPLVLDDPHWVQWQADLSAIPHVHTLRWHTRLPVVIPERLTPAFTQCLRPGRFQTALVLHSNHPLEWTRALDEALLPLRHQGTVLLNQSVLLSGVNDAPDTLVDLSQRMWRAGVLPYYMHRLDPVVGATHFHVPDSTAQALKQHMLARLPGYLVPRWVWEKSGASHKIPW